MVCVNVNEGLLEGEVVENDYGGSYCSFKGIPYAQPPVGDLRFKAPQPPKPWEGVRSAKEFGSMCFQNDMFTNTGIHGSEDCLYLNVYTPDVKPDKPLPVMFWIHGGAFVCGSGEDDFYGPEFLVREGVIVVTINYRLDVLGFLCLNTEDVPGNAGMKDQVQALRWVNKNIAHFGGDPENITLFGESAGGASVSYHLISPMSKGLFKRVIPQSGTSLCSWARANNPRERAMTLARQLGCYSEDDKELYEFFKNQPLESLVGKSVPVFLFEKGKSVFDLDFNIVQEEIFGDNERFFTGDYNFHEGCEVLLGYVTDEGLINLGTADSLKSTLEMARDYPEFFVSRPLALKLNAEQKLELGKKIRKFYFNDKINLTSDDWEQLVKFYSFDMFNFGILRYAKSCANTNKVYLYKFGCKTERNVVSHIRGTVDITGNKPVTCHADDNLYFFNAKLMPVKVDANSDTFKLIEKVVKLWTNFAKYGNPTPDDSLGAIWKQYTADDQDYFKINNEFEAGKAPDAEELQFWENILKEYESYL